MLSERVQARHQRVPLLAAFSLLHFMRGPPPRRTICRSWQTHRTASKREPGRQARQPAGAAPTTSPLGGPPPHWFLEATMQLTRKAASMLLGTSACQPQHTFGGRLPPLPPRKFARGCPGEGIAGRVTQLGRGWGPQRGEGLADSSAPPVIGWVR